MTSQRWPILFTVACVMLTVTSRGQNATHWTSYKMADGLTQPVFNSVSFTPQGRLLATSPNAPLAAELDGFSVNSFPAPPHNLGRIGESPGGQRWAMVPGGLMEFKDEGWVVHPVPEIAAAQNAGFPRTGGGPPFLPVRQGSVLYLLPEGLMEYSAENPEGMRTRTLRRAAQGRIGRFTGMAVARDGALWISGEHGLARLTGPVRNLGPETAIQEYSAPEDLSLSEFNQPEPGDNCEIILMAESGTDHQKVVITFDGRQWLGRPAGGRNFFRAWAGPRQALWAVNPESLYQWDARRTNWVENEEVSAGPINDVAREPGGAFWLATADGLFRCAPALWGKPASGRDPDLPVACVAAGGDGGIYFIAGNQLHRLQNEADRVFPFPAALIESPGKRSIFPLKDGAILVVAESGRWQLNPGDDSFQAVPASNPTNDCKVLGLLPDGGVGFYHSGEHPHFDEFNGTQFQDWPNPPEGFHVVADSSAVLFSTRNGDLWLGGGNGVWWCHNSRWQQFVSHDDTTPETAVGFVERPDGKIWCATPDKLWEFDGQNWLLLQTRFNHINALVQDANGNVWLASNGGLLRFCRGTWLEYGAAEGLPNGAVFAVCATPGGKIWAATTHGLSEFQPEADPDPPRTHVRRLPGDDRRLSEGDTLNLLFEGRDKWKYTPREGLLYSHQLDHLGWSAFREATAFTVPDLAAGRHSLEVRAMDRNGNVPTFPATLDFMVVTPWFHETRLWMALILGLAATVFFAAVAWQRHRQLLRSHAAVERTVAERTRELEIATRELLHSQKMNALGTLAAGIAHDFNNILSIIKGSAQIIGDNPDKPDKIRTRVERIQTMVHQGAEIVDAMLGFSRGSETSAVRCDINQVVAGTLKLLGDRFLREAEVKFERTENLPELCVSREFIQQILINFIFNAAEAMSGRKRITLTTGLAEQPPGDLFLSPAAADSFVLVSVRDEGSGIPPEIKARIFEPFFTTKALSARRGTGLGLSMAYELAKKMGAGLAVESVVGEGSVFTLILPVRPEPVALTRPATPVETLPK